MTPTPPLPCTCARRKRNRRCAISDAKSKWHWSFFRPLRWLFYFTDERKKIKQKTRKHLRRASIRVQAQSFHPTRPGSRQPQPPPPDGNTPTGRKDMWDNSTVKPDDTSAAELSSIHSLLYEMKQAAAMEREALRTTMNELDTKVTSLQTAIFNISSKGG